jgi:putative MATE family efflux protein
MDKQKQLREMPIGRLLWSFSLPSIIAMVVNAIYNVVDRIFIGQFVGEDALAGLTIAFPIMMILFAMATLIASGASALMSIQLGKSDSRKAGEIFGNALTLGIVLNIAVIVLLQLNLDRLLGLFGAEAGTLVLAKSYLRIILGGFIFNMIAFLFNFTVRTEGQARLPMVAMILSALSNIVLDALFVIVFGWGVRGAAAATILGQFSGFILLLSFYLRGKSSIKLLIRDLKLKISIVKEILITGMATFAGTVGNSLALGFLNQRLTQYGGTQAITSMGAINSLFTLFFMPLMGLQQGMQPIVGFNHGAEQHDRVNQTMKLAMIWATVFSTFVFICLRLFPRTLLSLFISSGSETMVTAVQGLNIFFLMLPFVGVSILGIAFFQATAQGKKALVLSTLRQFVCLIPLLAILPPKYGLIGVWAATPGADGIAILITALALWHDYRKREISHNGQISLQLESA